MSNEITTTTQQVNDQLLIDYLTATTPGLNDNQVKQFLAVSMAFGLNPWKKEVYAVTYNDKNGGKTMSIVTGYEVYLKRAELNPQYDGYEVEWNGTFVRTKVTKSGKNGTWQVDALAPKDGEDVSCICKVYRKDRRVPIKCEVFFSEYDQGNSMWQSKPRVMLEKVAIARAFRLAFPVEFGGMPYESAELPQKMGLDPEKEINVENAINGKHNAAKQAPAPAANKTAKAEPKATAKPFSVICNEEEKRIGTEAFNKVLFEFGVVDIKGVYDLGKKKYESFVEELRKLPDYVDEKIVEAEVVGNTDLFDDFA